MALTRKVQKKPNGQTTITIPQDIARSMELEQSQEMKIKVKGPNTLELTKKE